MKKLLSLCIVLVVLLLSLGIQNVDAATTMYTVHFNPNGGNITPTEQQYPAETVLSSLPIPTRDGYNFAGWYQEDYHPLAYERAFRDDYYGNDVLRLAAGDATTNNLFQIGYILVFDVTIGNTTPRNIDISDKYVDPSNYTIIGNRIYGRIPITSSYRNGSYSFLDINCNSPVEDYTVNEFKVYNNQIGPNPAEGSTLTSDINVYAKWEEKVYHIVTFNPNNGASPNDVTVEHNQKVDRPKTDPSKENFEFLGWYTGDLSVEYDFSKPVTDNMILRAKYNYTGTYKDLVIQLTETTDAKEMPLEERLGIDLLLVKGILVAQSVTDSSITSEVYSPAGKLLFTIDTDKIITPVEGLTADDNVSYTLTEEEKQSSADSGYFISSVTLSFAEPVKPSYSFTEGNGQTYTIGSSAGPKFKANGELSKLQDVLVDKASVATSDMKKESGSTIVTLNPSYADKLAVGDHTITFVYDDGECTANFKVAQAAAAPAGDSAPQPEAQQPVAAVTTYTPSTGDRITSCVTTLIVAILCLVSSVFYEKDLRRGKHSL